MKKKTKNRRRVAKRIEVTARSLVGRRLIAMLEAERQQGFIYNDDRFDVAVTELRHARAALATALSNAARKAGWR